MNTLNVTYPTLKTVIGAAASYYVNRDDGGYEVAVVGDTIFARTTIVGSDATAIADFAANYQARCTLASSLDDALLLGMHTNGAPLVVPRAPDGRVDVRTTVAKRTTNFQLRTFSFYTAKPQSFVHNVNPVTGADFGDVTVALYDGSGASIPVDGSATTLQLASVAKTVVDFEPAYNYEIIGGFMDTPGELTGGTTDAWYLSTIGVPGLADIVYLSEVNIEAITQQRVMSDGRAISYLPYQYGGVPHTNRLRFIFKQPDGEQKRFQLYIELFR